jgi:predicted nucleic acid-binding protein
MKLFFDTGALCALAIHDDGHNAEAKVILKTILARNPQQYTSNFILDETYTLIRSRRGYLPAINL